MIVQQLYTSCLSQGTYFICSEGEAAVIDPLREVDQYIQKAAQLGCTIKYVFETHFHADFVSGHLDLSKKTGAPIVYGPMANPDFDAYIAKDGERLSLGNITLEVLHTPGHTLESTCYLLRNENEQPYCLFSGDTLFIGDVGRPDLAQKSDLTVEDLAGMLYDSLRNKIMPLPDTTLIYPAHGAGSACGKNMSKDTFATLGHQRLNNYALDPQRSKADFIKELITDLAPPPAYFPQNVGLNKSGYESLDAVLARGANALSPTAFAALAETSGALVLDTRMARDFGQAHVPRSLSIGLNGQFAPWVGALIPDVKQPLLLITAPDQIVESLTRLSRVGYDNVLGYLEGGFATWLEEGREIDTITSISAAEMALRLSENQHWPIVDVRRTGEFASGHLQDAHNAPLDFINTDTAVYDDLGQQTFFLHCAGGYRSIIAASILKARGIHNFTEIEGGWAAIAQTDAVCAVA